MINHDDAREQETKWSTMPVQEKREIKCSTMLVQGKGKHGGQPCRCKKTENKVVNHADARKRETKWSNMWCTRTRNKVANHDGAREQETKRSTMMVLENRKQSDQP